ncbi:hypothetical protein GCM10010389_44240 [Streptomyces echinoruber]|uniref:Uncharacterized protein n=1 Tax=Streptomyces echinoruber TaxID=68898 RepID=A0A918RIJ9_9ACTN|nr:hypothetical protein GCM10010389_44240 [Streptomyces echinoruber]
MKREVGENRTRHGERGDTDGAGPSLPDPLSGSLPDPLPGSLPDPLPGSLPDLRPARVSGRLG